MITTTTTTILNNKIDLQQALNIPLDTSLSYNSSIESIINNQGGTVLYSYDNIIIASEITDSFYYELNKNPNIEYIESVPLKKYGDINYSLINQYTTTESTTVSTNTGLTNTGITASGSEYVNSFIEGINISGYTNDLTNYTNTLNTLTTTLQDGLSGKTNSTNTVMISPIITNDVFSLTGDTNHSFNYTITATGTYPIKYEIIAPTNYTGTVDIISNRITGTPDKGGVYTFIIKAINYYGSDSKEIILTTTEIVKITNTNLNIINIFGNLLTYQITSIGKPSSYTATSLPAGLILNSITGLINGTCSYSGKTNVTITATGVNGTDSKTLEINVGSIPIITSLGIASGKTFNEFTYIITSDSSDSKYKIVGDLYGLSFNNDRITGLPKIPGTINITLNASNLFGETNKQLRINISSY